MYRITSMLLLLFAFLGGEPVFAITQSSTLASFYSSLGSKLESDAQFRSLTVSFLKNALRKAELTIPVIEAGTDSSAIAAWVGDTGAIAIALKVSQSVATSSYAASIKSSVRSALADWTAYQTILITGLTNRISTGLDDPDFLQYWSQSYRSLPVSSGGMGLTAFSTYDLEWNSAVTGLASLYGDFPASLSNSQRTAVQNRLHAELEFYVRASACRTSIPGVPTPVDCELVTNFDSSTFMLSFFQNHGFGLHIAGLRAAEAIFYQEGSSTVTSNALVIAKYALTQTAQALSPDGSPLEISSYGYFLGSLGAPTLLPALETLRQLDPSVTNYITTPAVVAIPEFLMCALYPDLLSAPNFSDAEESLNFVQNLVPAPWFIRYLATKTRNADLLWLMAQMEQRYASRVSLNITASDLIYYDSSLTAPASAPPFLTYCYFPNRGIVISRQNLTNNSTMVAFEASHPLGGWLQSQYTPAAYMDPPG